MLSGRVNHLSHSTDFGLLICLFRSGHLLLYMFLAAGPDSIVLFCCEILMNSAGMPPILLHTQPKVKAQRELSGANQGVDATKTFTILCSLS